MERQSQNAGILAALKDGYVIDGGMEYFCSDECLHKRRVEMEMESPDHKKMSLEAVIVRLLDGEGV